MGSRPKTSIYHDSFDDGIGHVQRREWWLWATAITIMLLLTAGIVSYAFPVIHLGSPLPETLTPDEVIRGLVASVFLFDLYIIFQQIQIFRIRKRLSSREEMFRLISENAADMIAVVEASGKRVYNSPAYERILGYSVEELQQTSSLDQVHPEDREKVRKAAEEARLTHQGQSIEYRMKRKDGTWRIMDSTASTVLNDRGEVDKLIIVNRDVTDRRNLEKQLRQSQKMEAVGRLSGGVAHDFNNILGVIIGYAEILEEGVAHDEALRSSVEQVLHAGRQAASLTRQLLAFSRQQVLEPKILDVNTVIRETEKMLRRLIGEDILLETRLQHDLSLVKADQSQLEQAIINMAVNSRDAMPDGGQFVIETSDYEMTHAFVQQYSYPIKPGAYVLLSVKDTGSGMDPETQARIFEPFFTTKEKGKGTGLGLAMVYGFVKQSGGYIDVFSELGVGTTLNIYLPQVHGRVADESKPSSGVPAQKGSATILVVEDEASLRTLIVRLLQALGYSVLEAADSATAIQIGDQHGKPIDLLLTDVVMPGMNGRALAHRLLERRPGLRVLYMSGYTGQVVGDRGVIDEGSFFLPKPFSRDGLAQKVREVLTAVNTEVSS
jgi:two-component system cell cycle sensor histidine kinase/response regulator CckA